MLSSLFGECRCAGSGDSEIVFENCGPQNCYRQEDDYEEAHSDINPMLEQVGGLRGMSVATAQGRVFDCSPTDEVKSLMADLMLLRADVFAERGWDVEYLQDDVYCVNDRAVRIFLLPAGIPPPECKHISKVLGAGTAHMAGGIMVQDGPLCQPLWDYLLQTGLNEQYDEQGTENPSAVTGAARNLDCGFPRWGSHERIDAMRCAVVEAEIRQRVAVAAPTPRAAGSDGDTSVNLELPGHQLQQTPRRAGSPATAVGSPGPSRFSKGRSEAGSVQLRQGPSRFSRGRNNGGG